MPQSSSVLSNFFLNIFWAPRTSGRRFFSLRHLGGTTPYRRVRFFSEMDGVPLGAFSISDNFARSHWRPTLRHPLAWVICLSGITYYLYNEIAFLALGRVMQVTRHASSFRRFLEPINFHLRTVPISSRMTKIFEQPNRDLSNRKSRFSLHSTNWIEWRWWHIEFLEYSPVQNCRRCK